MREYRLIEQAINTFNLNLKGKIVYSEAASHEFLWTPIIAALANASFSGLWAGRSGRLEGTSQTSLHPSATLQALVGSD